MRRLKAWMAAGALALTFGMAQAASAGIIPYGSVGSYNATTYSFTATSTGHVIAYFVGGTTAGYTNEMGLLDNGVLTSAGYGLNNHATALGASFDLGLVTAGDTLVFVLHNVSPLGMNAYSDPSLNVAYDLASDTIGHNHIYSTAHAAGQAFAGVPAGTYVAFEDLQFPSSDFNYNDESFVFTNTSVVVTSEVPLPSAAWMGLATLGLLGVAARLRRRRETTIA